MRRLFREMRAHRFSMQGVVTAWEAMDKIQPSPQITKTRSKERSKQRKLDLLAQAQQAADRGGRTRPLADYQAISPKGPSS